jgi:tetratricopeptide (TPR) repeat protein
MEWLKKLQFILFLILSFAVQAQTEWPSPEVEQMYKEGRKLHSQGKLREAILLYKRAILIAPDIVILQRDLGQAYYLTGNYDEAENTLDAIIKNGAADEETYVTMSESLLALKEFKKAKNTLNKGLERFPHSGILYHELGKLYEEDEEQKQALKTWLAGIEADPGYHVNYYEAARTYMSTSKPIWAILYGEIFVNLEQQTPRANETRTMLIAAYKRLFNSLAIGEATKYGSKQQPPAFNGFEGAVYNTFLKLSPVVSDGINPENLTMLRARFIMDWRKQYADQYPFSLFTRQEEMLRNGYFDAYNQWLFGKSASMPEYEAWTKFHPQAIPDFEAWLQQHPFVPVASDFHNDKEVDDIFSKKKKK